MSTAPICLSCGIQMVERTNKETGDSFFGCPNYPKCTVTYSNDEYSEDYLDPDDE